MKAEDLSPGFCINYEGKNVRLRNWDLTSQFWVDQFEPIELTEDNIVELLGFEPVEGITGFYANKKGVEVDFGYKAVKVPNHVRRIRIPKYVHKLQQLIKALEE